MKRIPSKIKDFYGRKGKQITVRTPKVNAIVQRIHQITENIIQIFESEGNY
jgi:hypothetical protein